MQSTDKSYTDVVNDTMRGYESESRTGVNTTSNPFQMSRYDLAGLSIPLLTQKRIALKPLLVELQWYLSGNTNTQFLRDNGVTIWDLWANKDGSLGPVYGQQWRKWEDTRVIDAIEVAEYIIKGYDVLMDDGEKAAVTRNVDQLQNMVNQLRHDPDARRILLSAWNAGQLEDMNLPPCHMTWQVCSKELPDFERYHLALDIGYAHNLAGIESKYSLLFAQNEDEHSPQFVAMQLDRHQIPKRGLFAGIYQRSVDVGVGLPFNIAGYGVLTQFLAHITDHMAVSFTHFGGDVHIYHDHLEPLAVFMEREEVACTPRVILPEHWSELDDFNWEDIAIIDYQSQPTIKFPVAK